MPKKPEEPKKYTGPDLRELDDDELEMYQSAYPTNIHIKGEIKRRKNERMKFRQTRVGG